MHRNCMLRLIVFGLLAAAVSAQSPTSAPAFEVVRYDLELSVEPSSRLIRGQAAVAIRAGTTALEHARFALNERLKLSAVERDGKAAKFVRGARIAEGSAIDVALDPPLAAQQACTLSFTYEGEGLDPGAGDADWMGILLVRADEVRMSHQAQWYPIVPRDEAARSKLAAPTRLELRLPNGFESLGPGVLERVRKDKGAELHVWKSDRPVRASLIAGKFKAQKVEQKKCTVRVLAFAEHSGGAKAWAEEAATALDLLSGSFGVLDRASYGLAEMHVRNRERSYNFEADGFSVYDSVLFDGRAPDARKIAHEVGHVWFGGVADASGAGERFLTEGLAEHAALVYVEARSGAEAATQAALAAIKRYAGSPGDEVALSEADFGSPRYSQVVYAKGGMALRTLRHWISAKAVDDGVRGYLAKAKARGGAATFEVFTSALRDTGGADVDAWIEDWLRRPGTPQYSVEVLDPGTSGTARGRLLQTGPLYRNPVELELRLAKGKPVVLRVTPTSADETWELLVPAAIESVNIDPQAHVLFLGAGR